MTGQTPQNKTELLASIQESWSALQDTLAHTSASQLTTPTDGGGWTAKDHLAHATRWENSMVALLQRQPRHEGLGIDEALYLSGDFDAINAAIHQQTQDLSLDRILEDLAATHQSLVTLVQGMPEEELQQSYAYFLPDEPGHDDGDPIIGRIYGNSAGHFDEHREYIERIVNP